MFFLSNWSQKNGLEVWRRDLSCKNMAVAVISRRVDQPVRFNVTFKMVNITDHSLFSLRNSIKYIGKGSLALKTDTENNGIETLPRQYFYFKLMLLKTILDATCLATPLRDMLHAKRSVPARRNGSCNLKFATEMKILRKVEVIFTFGNEAYNFSRNGFSC